MNAHTDDTLKNQPRQTRRSPLRRVLYLIAGILLSVALVAGIVLIFFPNVILHLVVEPKLEHLITEKLGKRYALQMDSIFFSPGKDSLIILGGRITDTDSTNNNANHATQTPLDRFFSDRVTIAGLDYWKLIMQKGIFATSITVNSPTIYLHPGTLPNSLEDTTLLPAFLPVISAQKLVVNNARVFFSEKPSKVILPFHSGLLVGKASLVCTDFYLDEPSSRKSIHTFFSKSAAFHAEDISHLDSLGISDAHVATADGSLTDSTLDIRSAKASTPISEVRRVEVNQVTMEGFNWDAAIFGQEVHARTLTVSSPQISLQSIHDIESLPKRNGMKASDVIPIPSFVRNVMVDSIIVKNAELNVLLPGNSKASSIKNIGLTLHDFMVDSATPYSHISTFFSKNANFAVNGTTNLNTSVGAVAIGSINGTEKSVKVSKIRLNPSVKDIRLVTIESAVIGGVDIWKLLMREGFYAQSMAVSKPKIYLDRSATSPPSDIKAAFGSDPLAFIRSFVDAEFPLSALMPVVSGGAITVTDGSLYGIHVLDGAPESEGDSIMGLKASLRNFKLDRSTWTTKRGRLFSDGGTFSIGAFSHHTPESAYTFSGGGISGDIGKRTLTISSLMAQPLKNEEDFGNAYPYRTERIEFSAPEVIVTGVDYDKIIAGKGIYADNVTAADWKIDVYGDRRKPEEPRTANEVYPHEYFQYIKTPIVVNSATLSDGHISFSEKWHDGNEAGRISIDKINARIGQVSNQTSPMTPTTVDGNMELMHGAPMHFSMEYALMNPQFSFDIHGKLGAGDASIFNQYLKQAQTFTLTGGVRSAEFGLSIKDSTISGKIVPIYDSLVVEFFQWNTFPPGLFSWLANEVFMRSHNTPELDHPIKSGDITGIMERHTNIFWSIWYPLRNSISSVVRILEWVW